MTPRTLVRQGTTRTPQTGKWIDVEQGAASAPPSGAPRHVGPENGEWIPASELATASESAAPADLITAVLDFLLDEWELHAEHQSSIRRATKHPAYRLLLRAPSSAIPKVLDRLAMDRSPLWVWALGDLAEVDAAAGAETMDEAADRWLAWGAEHLRVD